MADPVFVARLLAASAIAVVLALCATNAKGSGERAQLQAAHSLVGFR